MDRIVFFDILSGYSVGEAQADCSRGWAINEGGQAQIALPLPVPEWLGLGMMAMIEHPRLPAWAGMVDTDWQAAPGPVVTLYNAEYLLNLRGPDAPLTLRGTAAAKLAKVVQAANEAQPLFLEVGDVEGGGLETTEEWDQRTWWAQLTAFAKARSLELACEPARRNGRLIIRVNLLSRLGVDTSVELHDGPEANLEVTSAKLTGEIWNRVIGVGKGSGKQSRLQSKAFVDEDSAQRYRLRSHVVQFQDAGDVGQLEALAKESLAQTRAPGLVIEGNVLDQGTIFEAMRLGNSVLAHAANLYLPNGRVGWRGRSRLQAFSYDRAANKLAVQLEGRL